MDDLLEAKTAIRRVEELDRVAIRSYALDAFSPERMVANYEKVYRQLVTKGGAGP